MSSMLPALVLVAGLSVPATDAGASGVPLDRTEFLECILVAIYEDGILAVRDLRDGSISLVSVAPEIPLLRPAMPHDLAIDLKALEVGQILKISHHEHTREITEIKVFERRGCSSSVPGPSTGLWGESPEAVEPLEV